MTDVGELQPLGIVIRDIDPARTPINAATVTLTLTLPDQTIIVPAIANPPGVTGNYLCDYIPTMPGLHRYRWQTTSPALVLEGTFDVVTPGDTGLISLQAAKDLLRIELDDDEHDDNIRQVIRAATTAAENEADEIIQRRPLTQSFRFPQARRTLHIARLPILSMTRVVDRDSGFAWTADMLDPDENGIVESLGAPFRGRLRAEYVAGPAIVNPNYVEAIGYIVQHLWRNRQGQGKPVVGGQSAFDGSDMAGMGYSIPNRAKDLLGRPGPKAG